MNFQFRVAHVGLIPVTHKECFESTGLSSIFNNKYNNLIYVYFQEYTYYAWIFAPCGDRHENILRGKVFKSQELSKTTLQIQI